MGGGTGHARGGNKKEVKKPPITNSTCALRKTLILLPMVLLLHLFLLLMLSFLLPFEF